MDKNIDIVSIGDELLIGQVVNSNASWMGQKLSEQGMKINRMLAIADTREAILNTLEDCANKARVVLITGGLGPTKDDLTKDVACDFFGSKLVLNEEVRNHVAAFFEKRGFDLTKLNYWQAMVPDNCQVIPNAVGTAPGMYFEKDGVHYLFMPGVPMEMKYIMQSWAIPFFKEVCKPKPYVEKTVLTHGMGESFLADKIADWENNLPDYFSLAYLPSPGRVRLRISARGEKQEVLQKELEMQIEKLKQNLGNLFYGYNDDTLEEVVGKLLLKNNATLSTAESCTGGLIAHRLTSVSGASAYFKGSVVAYANEIKMHLLNVKSETLEKHGAVSEETVIEMVQGVIKNMNTDIGIAVSGIAGPTGGTPEKPVGTVYIGIQTPFSQEVFQCFFHGSREQIQNQSVAFALEKLAELLDIS